MTTDMTGVIIPRSDQINADDLIAGPITIRIAEVDIRPGTEQPVSIHFDGGNGKVFRPCKSMSRVLVAAWGPDAKAYVGRSVTLYRDPKVKWGGMEVGGIRISHMTHIEREMVMALTATKGKRTPYSVKPLVAGQSAPANDGIDKAATWAAETIASIEAADSITALAEIDAKAVKAMTKLATDRPELHADVKAAISAREQALSAEGPADEQRGEAFADDPFAEAA